MGTVLVLSKHGKKLKKKRAGTGLPCGHRTFGYTGHRTFALKKLKKKLAKGYYPCADRPCADKTRTVV